MDCTGECLGIASLHPLATYVSETLAFSWREYYSHFRSFRRLTGKPAFPLVQVPPR